MADTQQLEQKIIDDAKERASQIITNAREQADGVLQEAQHRLDSEKQNLLKIAQKNADEEYDRAVAMGKMEIRKDVLAQKQSILDEVLNRSFESIINLPVNEYLEFLCRLAKDLIKTGDEEIILSENDKERIGKQFVEILNKQALIENRRGAIKLSNESRQMAGGFILRSGNVEINYSIEDVLKAKKSEIEIEVANILFNEQ